MYEKSRYDKLNEVTKGSFYEDTCRKAAGSLHAVCAVFRRVVCVTRDRHMVGYMYLRMSSCIRIRQFYEFERYLKYLWILMFGNSK